MTEPYFNGNATFSVNGLFVSGLFANGKLVNGHYKSGNVIYTGTFESDELHGDNCTLQIRDIKYVGRFRYGVFIEGKVYKNDKLTEEGKYDIDNNTTQKTILVNGTKYYDDTQYTGLFNRYGELKHGYIAYENGITYTGEFDKNVMRKGRVNYPDGFTSLYELCYDNERRIDLLRSCSVQYNGKWEALNNKQCVLLCCKGADSKLAHRFYVDYLSNFNVQTLLLIKREFFNKKFTVEEEVGLQQILSNINSYMTTGKSELVDYTKNEDPLPFETERVELDKHY